MPRPSALLVPANIREGVKILGVEGSTSSSEGMKPQAKSDLDLNSRRCVRDSAYNCLPIGHGGGPS